MLVSGNLGLVWLLLLTFGLNSQLTQADHILAIFSYAFSSPYLVARPFIKALVDRGHQVTIISALNRFPTIKNAHHIRVPKLDHLIQDLIDYDYNFDSMPSKWKEAAWISHFYHESSYLILEHSGVQELLQDSNVHFDMVIMDTPHSDALCCFAQRFNAPLVGIASYGTSWMVDYLAGNSAPSIYDPISPMGYTIGSSSLLDKWYNWIFMTEEWLLDRLVYLPLQMKLYRDYFDNTYKNFEEIRRNFSLILVNQHFSLGRARANVPNLIEVAGMHMDLYKDCKPDPLPEDLQNFMDEAEHGVIYFSMGVEIYINFLPKDMKHTLLEVFSKLKQRVIWKNDEWESFTNKSDNIYARSFLPQQQILNHPKVKLFITHAGLLSIIEAAYYGVPILSLPLYYDQFANAERMRLAGVGKTLDINSMNVEMLNKSISDLLQNPFYKRKAKEMSTRFRDQPMSPLDTAIWWTEYVLRHKGASHMRIAEHDISLMQYYSIDIVSILFGRIGLAAVILIFLNYELIKYIKYRLYTYITVSFFYIFFLRYFIYFYNGI